MSGSPHAALLVAVQSKPRPGQKTHAAPPGRPRRLGQRGAVLRPEVSLVPVCVRAVPRGACRSFPVSPEVRNRPATAGGAAAAAMVQLGSRLLKSYRGGHVVIRFALGGCTNRPFYRIVAAHSKRARDGKYLEQLGCLDPLPNAHGEKVAGLNLERLRHWLGCGAQLSRPAEKLLGLAGFLPLHPMTITNAERLRRRRRRAQESVVPPTEGGSQEPGAAV